MTLKISASTVNKTFEEVQRVGNGLLSVCNRSVNQITGGGVTLDQVVEDLLPQLIRYKGLFVDSSGWPQSYKDSLNSYVIVQGLSANYVTDYESVRASLNTAIATTISLIPVDGEGFVRYVKLDGNGNIIYEAAPDLTTLLTDLNNLIGLLG